MLLLLNSPLNTTHLRPNTSPCRAKFAQSSIQLPIDPFGRRKGINGHRDACLLQHRSMCAQQTSWLYCVMNAELLCWLQVVPDCTHEPCDTAGGVDNDTKMSKHETADCILNDCPCTSTLEAWAVDGNRLPIAAVSNHSYAAYDVGHCMSLPQAGK